MIEIKALQAEKRLLEKENAELVEALLQIAEPSQAFDEMTYRSEIEWRRDRAKKAAEGHSIETNPVNPLALINALRETDPYIQTIFTEGGCYRFHLFLKKFWPEAVCHQDVSGGHVVTLIGDIAYDIRGVYDKPHRPMTENEERGASEWTFASRAFLEIGECKFCYEPILAQPTTN